MFSKIFFFYGTLDFFVNKSILKENPNHKYIYKVILYLKIAEFADFILFSFTFRFLDCCKKEDD